MWALPTAPSKKRGDKGVGFSLKNLISSLGSYFDYIPLSCDHLVASEFSEHASVHMYGLYQNRYSPPARSITVLQCCTLITVLNSGKKGTIVNS